MVGLKGNRSHAADVSIALNFKGTLSMISPWETASRDRQGSSGIVVVRSSEKHRIIRLLEHIFGSQEQIYALSSTRHASHDLRVSPSH